MNAREAIEDIAARARWTVPAWDKVIPYPNGTRKVSYTRGRFIVQVHYSNAQTVLDAKVYMNGLDHKYGPDRNKRAWVITQLANGKMV